MREIVLSSIAYYGRKALRTSCSNKNGSLFAAMSSGVAICPLGIMDLHEVASCAS